jgi:hypothetical protein
MAPRKGAFLVPVLTGFIPRLAAASFGSCRNLAVGID